MTVPSSLISHPEEFSGKIVKCKWVLLQCSLYLSGQVNVSDHQKITQCLSLFLNKALIWATAVWEQGSESPSSYEHFVELFHRPFDCTLVGKEIAESLQVMTQNKWSMAEYALEFYMLVVGSEWNELALKPPSNRD